MSISNDEEHVPFGETRVGTCSKCGGAVCVPTVWGSVVPPTPKCAVCGSIKKTVDKQNKFRYPIIDME